MPTGEVHARKTHCPQGHPYAGDNLYVYTSNNGKRGRHCRTCLRERHRAYVAKDENRERIRLRDAQRSRSRRGLNRDLHLRRQFGITLADEIAMIEAQGGRCAICPTPLTNKNRQIDHDHATGQVRGVLCISCNGGLGLAKDDPDILRAMADYVLYHRGLVTDR